MNRLRTRSRAGGGGFNPLTLWPDGASSPGLFYLPSDVATAYQDSAGTTAGAVDSPVGLRLDKRLGATAKADPGNHALQATSAARPTLKLASGIYSDLMDGVDDGYTTASGITLGAAMTLLIALKRNTTSQMLVASETPNDASQFIGVMQSGGGASINTAAGSAWTCFVNGVQVGGTANTTRDQLNTAMTVGSFRVLEIRNLDLSAWVQFSIGAYSSFMLNVNMGGAMLFPTPSDASQIERARNYIAAQVGLSL